MMLARYLSRPERQELVAVCRELVTPELPIEDVLGALSEFAWSWLMQGDRRGVVLTTALGAAFAETRDILINAQRLAATRKSPEVWTAPSALLEWAPWRAEDEAARVAFRRHRGVHTYAEAKAQLEQERVERLAAVASRRRSEVRTEAEADREMRRRLMEDPSARELIGERLHGRRKGDRIVRAECPACGRKSVWWYIDPGGHTNRSASCEHRNSCGWGGSLYDLALGMTGGQLGTRADARQAKIQCR